MCSVCRLCRRFAEVYVICCAEAPSLRFDSALSSFRDFSYIGMQCKTADRVCRWHRMIHSMKAHSKLAVTAAVLQGLMGHTTC